MSRGFELISDLHKDARGFRPSSDWMATFDAAPESEQAQIWDSLCGELERAVSEEEARAAAALDAFEARLQGMMDDYGISMADALRWDMDAFDVDLEGAKAAHGVADQEVEHYLWTQGLAFDDMPKFSEVILKEVA